MEAQEIQKNANWGKPSKKLKGYFLVWDGV